MADHVIHVLATKVRDVAESKERQDMICTSFSKSEEGYQLLNAITKQVTSARDLESLETMNTSYYKASWCTQFRVLLWRSVMAMLKDPQMLTTELLFALVCTRL